MAVTVDRTNGIVTMTATNDELNEFLNVERIICKNAANAGSWTFATSLGATLPSIYTAANDSKEIVLNRAVRGIKMTALPTAATGAYILLRKRG